MVSFKTNYRSKIFTHGEIVNAGELRILLELYPKNYQVWRFISLHSDDSVVATLVETALEIDSKNYHAWEILIERSSLLNFGTRLAHMLLQKDQYNNSAKNYLLAFNGCLNK